MTKYDHRDLINFSSSLLVKSGLPKEHAEVTAKTLVEADLMGHTTHGLALMAPYLSSIDTGGMTLKGAPETIRDLGSVITWNGRYLPGCWLTHKAIDVALERIKDHPVVTITINRSHHIGCLAGYPERGTREDLILILSCSDPKNQTVAPYGGLTGMYSPNPMAYGVPTQSMPIIVDISMSTTANGLINNSHRRGEKLSHSWLLNNKGEVTNDPEEFFKTPPATILPLGGIDAGYKGFGLGILVEILTSGLAGHGRVDKPQKWGASVFLQVIDPEAFGGKENFKKQTQHLVDTFKQSKPVDPKKPVRIPGERALKLRSINEEEGIELHPEIISSLKDWGIKLGVPINLFLSE